MITPIHTKMRRCMLSLDGTRNYYLDPLDSHYRENAPASISGTAQTTGILSMTSPGSFATGVKAGQYVKNITRDTYSKITDVNADTLTFIPLVGTTGLKWGSATSTSANKLIDSAGDFVNKGVEVGDIAWNRAAHTFAEVLNVSATELDLSANIFSSGTKYSVVKRNFRHADQFEVCTADFSGDDGYCMVEIPKFYFRHDFANGKHRWVVSEKKYAGLSCHPAFLSPDGTKERKYIYMSAFEGAAGNEGTQQGVRLIDYNLGNAKLFSLPGYESAVRGQMSEFRQVSRNNGAGWQQLDWYCWWAVQLLMMVEFEDMDSQAILGQEFAGWTNHDRDAYTISTNERVVGITGSSLRNGNGSTTFSPAGSYVGSYSTWRGIENPWGHTWKWVDGANINNRRLWLSNSPASYADDVFSGGYADAGHTMPTSNGFISAIHNSQDGLIPSGNSGSENRHIPDFYFQNSGVRVALVGSRTASGADAGFAALNVSAAASFRFSLTGGRVCFRDVI